jgi:hypothetical protein
MMIVSVRNIVFVTAAVLIGAADSFAQIEFMAAPMSFDNETVTDAPYSADAITEVVQPLADGNRIVRQNKSQLARDSVGRTRREQGLAMLGPIINELEEFRHVQITDPQTRTIIMLNMKEKTAEKMPAPNIRMMTKMEGGKSIAITTRNTFEMALPTPPPLDHSYMFFSAEARGPMPQPATESLGTQFMEGVQAEGTRTTFTIPAGQVGNDLPINVVSERWYSPDLKVLVMSRQSDPRFGQTTYRLTNIVRGEPSPSLFEVPADFTVTEAGQERDVIIRKIVK